MSDKLDINELKNKAIESYNKEHNIEIKIPQFMVDRTKREEKYKEERAIEEKKKTIKEAKREKIKTKKRYVRNQKKPEWKKVKSYSEENVERYSDKVIRRIGLSLAIIGMVTTLGVTGVAVKKALDWGEEFTEGFWDETKARLEEKRKEYELFYGDYFPNGEKKRRLTHKEWEELPGDSRFSILEPPLDDETEENKTETENDEERE